MAAVSRRHRPSPCLQRGNTLRDTAFLVAQESLASFEERFLASGHPALPPARHQRASSTRLAAQSRRHPGGRHPSESVDGLRRKEWST